MFLGAETREALRKLQLVRARMLDAGVLWIIRPKGSKAISESDVYDAAKAAGLVDTKVVAFSKTHTAHKCVIPLELRGQAIRPRPPILSIPPSAPAMQPKKAAAGAGAARPPAKPARPARKAAKKPLKPKAKAKAKADAKPKKRR